MFSSGWELVFLILIGLVFFGANRLPGIARSLGQGIREFRDSTAPRPPNERGRKQLDHGAGEGGK